EPLRRPEQLRQLQFHWGKPPPAADPSTRILTTRAEARPPAARHQRLDMYMVISMPKRTSIARRVSQRMPILLSGCRTTIPNKPGRRKALCLLNVRRGSPGWMGGERSALAVARRDAAGEALERAARGGLGDVLAPERLALSRLAAELVAVAGPEDVVILGPPDLDRAAREVVGVREFVFVPPVSSAWAGGGTRDKRNAPASGAHMDYSW